MSKPEQPTSRPLGFQRHLRRMRYLALIPWPCLWFVGSFLCRSRWGRRCITWQFRDLRRFVDFSQQLFTALELPPERADLELTRVYQTGLFQAILMARLARLSPAREAQQFEVCGLEYLKEEQAAGRPLILGGSHFGVNRLFPLWLARRGVELLSLEQQDQLALMGVSKPATLRSVEVRAGFKAQATFQALRHLQAGGCVQMTGDRQRENDEQQCVRRTFRGITRPYPLGIANLSLLGGAAILPYFCTLQPGGRVRIEIHPPLRPPAPPAPAGTPEREAQIEQLVHQFAAVMEAVIEEAPGNVRWM
ncbi:MAG: hypothetical protein ACKOU6_11270 [Planctomycetota bacterium]